ncbi:nucleotide pyrophosphohydrolase [Pseudomonas sp. PB120]|jgi:NTP pyrophosphatase (non-canonical NTP hydrolase)|uniref:nucleotide pyrophosphohydrolase n=1 Tax=Pseudomonas sp. PB120 TaxID=2494700 RepID=UPI00273D28F7|nr:nucleotide pyrophosphohydrolase [Pseudomonas sp. PB120]
MDAGVCNILSFECGLLLRDAAVRIGNGAYFEKTGRGGHEMDVVKVQQQLRDFASERDWEQFHTPKNLASALAVEAAELLENFQWLTDEQARLVKDDAERMRRIEEEIADVTLYLLRLADVLSLDLQDAVDRKLRINADKYPADKARGNAKKYNEL